MTMKAGLLCDTCSQQNKRRNKTKICAGQLGLKQPRKSGRCHSSLSHYKSDVRRYSVTPREAGRCPPVSFERHSEYDLTLYPVTDGPCWNSQRAKIVYMCINSWRYVNGVKQTNLLVDIGIILPRSAVQIT